MSVNLFGLPTTDPGWFYAGKNTPRTHIRNVRAGGHPLGRALLGKEGARCGNCRHVVEVLGCARPYFKCEKDRHRWTGGPGTDIRKKWAACELWEEG
jgi:hypothetical protein